MKYTDLDILFLTKEIPDYLQDAIFLGLTQLGCNVVDYPRKGSLHGISHPSEFHSEQLLFNLPEKESRKKPDLMVVTSLAYDYNPLGVSGWMSHVKETELVFEPEKTVALDGSDKQETQLPILKTDYSCVLKREMFKRHTSSWYHINFCPILEPFKYRFYEERDIDFSYMASPSHPYRNEVADFLKDVSKRHGLNSVVFCGTPTRPRQEYLDVLSRSRCAISVKGMGYGTYRYWEIPAKGTVMIAQDVGIPIDNDFDSSQCFKFKELNELEGWILQVKEMSNVSLSDMAYAALRHISDYHTPIKRAEYLLSCVYRNEIMC